MIAYAEVSRTLDLEAGGAVRLVFDSVILTGDGDDCALVDVEWTGTAGISAAAVTTSCTHKFGESCVSADESAISGGSFSIVFTGNFVVEIGPWDVSLPFPIDKTVELWGGASFSCD